MEKIYEFVLGDGDEEKCVDNDSIFLHVLCEELIQHYKLETQDQYKIGQEEQTSFHIEQNVVPFIPPERFDENTNDSDPLQEIKTLKEQDDYLSLIIATRKASLNLESQIKSQLHKPNTSNDLKGFKVKQDKGLLINKKA